MRRIIMNKSVYSVGQKVIPLLHYITLYNKYQFFWPTLYIQLLSITLVSFKSCLKYLLINRNLQFCTIRGGFEVRQLAAIFGSVNCKPVNRNFSEFFFKGRLS